MVLNPNEGWKPSAKTLMTLSVMAMTSMNAFGEPIHNNVVKFDTDSGLLGIDNQYSTCISHVINDFDRPLQDVDQSIKGFGGQKTYDVKQETLVWK